VQPPLTFTAKNFIDDEIFGKMLKDGIRWTAASTDEAFLRRITLDLTGAIPDADTTLPRKAGEGKRQQNVRRGNRTRTIVQTSEAMTEK